ncbi:hypothetical protein BT93_L4493 [Corymbia citriodora subsp. variegata]|uniref:rRNA processing protein EBP2 n=1 Tax=Corymbia citriodora subsp. variegata TaxID=360336 RepID=A0A8T0CK49_CORYI|nr:hypothetical protein BT93_L4493 [Corymbia citriodora subsp. variegata]
MAKGSKLKNALDRYQGVNHKLEHQKKLQKTAEKRKRSKIENDDDEPVLEDAVNGAQADTLLSGTKKDTRKTKKTKTAPAVIIGESDSEEMDEVSGSEGWETDDGEAEAQVASALARLAESDDSDSEDDDEELDNAANGIDAEEDDDEDEEDVPLSDLESIASEDKGDIIPHQRLTINNTAALLRAYKSIALPSKLPFSENQVVMTDAQVEIEDVDDDLNRELAFYKQSLEAVTRARALLRAEGVPFSRPADYFAEMVKSDEHMGKIKQKLVDEAASKKASADARRQRDLKKFGKQVQVAKLQERDRSKRETMEKINLLKRKRQGADIGNAKEDDLFDVALEDAATTAKKDRSERRGPGGAGGPKMKRQKRDEKFGYGGKKRFGKSNDAKSSADTSGFSVKKMKGGKKGAQRPGKSRRAKF